MMIIFETTIFGCTGDQKGNAHCQMLPQIPSPKKIPEHQS
jgi:hypothetical protein